MNYRLGFISGIVATLILVGAGWWIMRPPREVAKIDGPPPPASVTKIAKEDQFNLITLTVEAEKRLAIQTGVVERKPMKRTRTYGGEVMIPPGHAIIVSAPLSGTLRLPSKGVVLPGAIVKKGQPIFELLPLLTPEGRANLSASRVDADGMVNNAQTQVEAMKIALDRAKRLLNEQVGSKRMVDDAQAAFDIAEKTLQAAKARRDLFTKVVGDIDSGLVTPLIVDAPENGLIRSLTASPGQTVPSGAVLFEVVDPNTVWVRVPVYVGDESELDAAAEARISTLSAKPNPKSEPARHIDAPPSANLLTGTVDLIYQLDNRKTHYSPGQRVGVSIALAGEEESLIVPWASVIHDINGGTWIYEKTADRTYLRRRVIVQYVSGTNAVLMEGPPVGTKVVTAGAAELFGTEVGFSK